MLTQYLSIIRDTISLLRSSDAYYPADQDDFLLFRPEPKLRETAAAYKKSAPQKTRIISKTHNTTSEPLTNKRLTGENLTGERLTGESLTNIDSFDSKIKDNITVEKNAGYSNENHNVNFLQKIKIAVEKTAPQIIDNNIPNDEEAKFIAQKWKYFNKTAAITIITATQNTQEHILLKNLAKALTITIMPSTPVDAASLESEDVWKEFLSSENLKIIVIDEETLNKLPNLKKYYKQIPATKENLLKNIPVFHMRHISHFIKQPLEKAFLWQNLLKFITAHAK
jgi:hypothetical protein